MPGCAGEGRGADGGRERREPPPQERGAGVKVRELVSRGAEFEIADVYEFAQVYQRSTRPGMRTGYDGCGERPLARPWSGLCKDLMLSRDWSRWDARLDPRRGRPKRTASISPAQRPRAPGRPTTPPTSRGRVPTRAPQKRHQLE